MGDYRLPGYYNLGIVQTFVDFDDNRDLKPSKSVRTELGLDYRLPFGNINVTGFYNHLYNGITSESVPMARQVADIEITYNGNQLPTYEVIGYSPFFYGQNKLVNKYNSTDKGVEFFMSFEKTPLRNVSFDVQGSYTETMNLDDVESLYRSNNTATPEKFGIFKSYEEKYRQFRVGSNLNYHLPKIGLVISLRTEHFIVQRADREPSNRLIAYLDENFNRVEIPEADRTNSTLYGHLFRPDLGISMAKEDKIYNNFHLRLSKDFLNGFRFSFYANNFLDLNQTEIGLENGQYVRRTKTSMVQLSFGSKIEYQF